MSDRKTAKSVFYSYCEGVSNKGQHEVAIFVLDCIKRCVVNDTEALHLFSDNCAGRNRNHTMVRIL